MLRLINLIRLRWTSEMMLLILLSFPRHDLTLCLILSVLATCFPSLLNHLMPLQRNFYLHGGQTDTFFINKFVGYSLISLSFFFLSLYIYIYNYILIKIKITKIHSTVPYLTVSKSGRENIKYKRKFIKRKLFKIYILGS